MTEENEAVKAYLKREEFLQKQVAFMMGYSIPPTGEGIKIFNELMEAEITDADRDRILEIIDERILQFQKLKILCHKLEKARKRSEEKE